MSAPTNFTPKFSNTHPVASQNIQTGQLTPDQNDKLQFLIKSILKDVINVVTCEVRRTCNMKIDPMDPRFAQYKMLNEEEGLTVDWKIEKDVLLKNANDVDKEIECLDTRQRKVFNCMLDNFVHFIEDKNFDLGFKIIENISDFKDSKLLKKVVLDKIKSFSNK